MKKLFEPTHIDLLNEFDNIKSIIKNEKIPQFNIVGIKNKRIHSVLSDFYTFDTMNDCFNKLSVKLEIA
jgi:N-acetylneuraminic acid mutarotase